jgi:hypothetical protein
MTKIDGEAWLLENAYKSKNAEGKRRNRRGRSREGRERDKGKGSTAK